MFSFRLPLVAAVCALALPFVDRAAEPPAGEALPQIEYRLDSAKIWLHGDVSSVAHEAILRQTVLHAFPDREQVFDLSVRSALPPGWALLSEMTLRALVYSASGTAKIDLDGVRILAVTTDARRSASAAARITKSLLSGMQLHQQFEEIPESDRFSTQCDELFRKTADAHRIEFAQGGSEIGTASMAALDRLVQIAADCPDTTVEIAGYLDVRASNADHAALGQARAIAVAAYFAARGIDSGRLSTPGADASTQNATTQNARMRRKQRSVYIRMTRP